MLGGGLDPVNARSPLGDIQIDFHNALFGQNTVSSQR